MMPSLPTSPGRAGALPRRLAGFVCAVALLLGPGCTGNPVTIVPEQVWGSDDALLTITATGANLNAPCAFGVVEEPFRIGADGTFDFAGTYVREVGPAELPFSARYSGHVRGGTMVLSIHLTESGQGVGPFTLVRGVQPPFVRRCQ